MDAGTVTATAGGKALIRTKGTTATQRLKQDYMRIVRDPVPYVTAHPLSSNILTWHYVVRGPESTVYEGGLYHGKLVFPAEFPFKPPAIYMTTPNGRFKSNVRLCLSISDYHPDTWNPAWSVSTILTGLLSFMMEDKPTMGSIEASDYERRVLAKQSADFNLTDATFVELFPDIVSEIRERKKKSQSAAAAVSATAAASAGNKRGTSVTGKVSELGQRIRSQGIRAMAAVPHNAAAGVIGGKDSNSSPPGLLSSVMSTAVIVFFFVAFLYTVRHVLHTTSSQSSGQ